MKITCNIEVFNRVLTSLNLRRSAKFTVATVALCKKASKGGDSEKDAYLIVCTSQNPCRAKYKVYNNIENVFNKFMNEGKATIRIKEPAHDIIMSKADPLQLRTFLHAVGLTLTGQGKGQVQLSVPPTKIEQPVQQKMIIQKRKDYFKNKSNFPSSLVFLRVQNCKLAKVERHVIELNNLQILDLSNNSIRELPVALAELRLKELILSDNQIEWFPPELSIGPLGQNLQVLDLSKNSITKLSIYFCSMKNLRVLSLKCNHLTVLPRNIACLESLRMFSASHNHIRVLPFGMRKLQLDTLDLFHNPLDADVVLRPEKLWSVPTLLEWAAYSVVVNKVPYTPQDIPKHLIDFIVQRCPCPCGRQVFQRTSYCILVLDLYKLASTVVYINNTSRFKVPLQVYFCSTKCWKNFYRWSSRT